MKNTTAYNKNRDRKITRKQALTKMGLTALTTASVLFLSTKQSSALSNLPEGPGSGW